MVRIAVGSGLRNPVNPETDHDRDGLRLAELIGKGSDADLLSEMMAFVVNRMMDLDVESLTCAAYGERSDIRINQRTGYRDRPWHTTIGTLPVAIPKLRKDSYFPSLVEVCRTSDRALIAVISGSVRSRCIDVLRRRPGQGYGARRNSGHGGGTLGSRYGCSQPPCRELSCARACARPSLVRAGLHTFPHELTLLFCPSEAYRAACGPSMITLTLCGLDGCSSCGDEVPRSFAELRHSLFPPGREGQRRQITTHWDHGWRWAYARVDGRN